MNVVRRVGLALLAPAIALVVAAIISAFVILAIGEDPLVALRELVNFGDNSASQMQAVAVILNRAIPLFLAGLAVSIGFRMGLFNIGVEGQYRLATIMAAWVGTAVVLPRPVQLLLIIVVAMAVGAIWAGIAGILKVTRGVSEVISTIMLNFIAIGLASYLLTGPFRGTPEGSLTVATEDLPESGRLPGLNGVMASLGLAEPRSELYGFLIPAIVVGVLVAILVKRTRFGFDLKASGLNPTAATASGVNARAMVVKAMLLSGALAGLIGLPDLVGDTYHYGTEFTSGLGFLGIAVALLGRNNPLGIAFGALLFGFLDRAALSLQFAGIPSQVVTIIQGTIVLAVVIANEVARRIAIRQAERTGANLPTARPAAGEQQATVVQ
ncbi:MAG: ABC transporter permease [Geodermatophilaceae bacterium]|nr:ABC transporter permease [Geodermatophilaceae bacterium]MDQ3457058.1 ABC transporter permease [Actinomycetota bacterium]